MAEKKQTLDIKGPIDSPAPKENEFFDLAFSGPSSVGGNLFSKRKGAISEALPFAGANLLRSLMQASQLAGSPKNTIPSFSSPNFTAKLPEVDELASAKELFKDIAESHDYAEQNYKGENLSSLFKKFAETKDPQDFNRFLDYTTNQVAQQIPQQVVLWGGQAVGIPVPLTLGVLGASSAGQSYLDDKEQAPQLSESQMRQRAAISGASEVASEGLSLGLKGAAMAGKSALEVIPGVKQIMAKGLASSSSKLFQKMSNALGGGPTRRILTNALVNALGEGGEEVANQAVQIMSDEAYGVRFYTLAEKLDSMIEVFGISAIASGLVGSPMVTAVEIQRAVDTQQFMDIEKQAKPMMENLQERMTSEVNVLPSPEELFTISHIIKRYKNGLPNSRNMDNSIHIVSADVIALEALVDSMIQNKQWNDAQEQSKLGMIGEEIKKTLMNQRGQAFSGLTKEEISKGIGEVQAEIREVVSNEVETLKEYGEGFKGGEIQTYEKDGGQTGYKRTSLPKELKHPKTGNKPVNNKQWKELAIHNLRQGISITGEQENYRSLLQQKFVLMEKLALLEGKSPPSKPVEKSLNERLINKAPVRAPGKEQERQFVTSVKTKYEESKVSGQYIPRSTDELAQKARTLISEDLETAESMAKTGTNDKAVAVASELIKHYGDKALASNDDSIKNALYDKQAEIANAAAENLTELGRSVQAASILGRLTPEGQLRFAAREIQKYNEKNPNKKIPHLTGEQSREIMEESSVIQKMPEGIEKSIAQNKLRDKIQNLVPTPLFQKLLGIWKAGLLTGLKTSGLNISSNFFHALAEVAKDYPASIVDSVASLFTKQRTLSPTLKGVGGGVKEGFEKGWRYLKTGYDERNISIKLDYKRINFGKSVIGKALQFYEEGIFRILGSEDQPFYYGAKARSLYSQAIAKSKNMGFSGDQANTYISNLINNPSDDMIRNAVKDAEIAVFQNKTQLGDAAKKVQSIGGGLGEVIVPFGRTPAAVAMQILNYSPAGIVKTIIENIGKGKFDQRAFAQGIGRGITGTTAIAIGSALFQAGIMALGFPGDDKERKQWELEGKKPNTVLIDGKWRNVNVLGPLGVSLIIGGYFSRGLKDTGSVFQSLIQAGLGGVKSLTEQTFLQGVNQFTSAINDPAGYGPGVIGNLLGSIVPTIISDIAQVKDPLQRRTSAKKEGMTAPLKGRIPGVRETLEPKVDVLGNVLERPGSKVETMIDPSRPSAQRSSAVINEFKRLTELGYSPTPTTFAENYNLTPQQKTEIMKSAGETLNSMADDVIHTEGYKSLSNEEKSKILIELAERIRGEARIAMAEKIAGSDILGKIPELVKSGLLTKESAKKLLERRYGR